MAAAFFNAFAPRRRAMAVSAETTRPRSIQPEIVTAMLEVGIDLRHSAAKQLTPERTQGATILVTMGCRDEGPADEHAIREEWFVADPAGKDIGEVRRIRDKLRRLVFALIEGAGWARTAGGVPAAAQQDAAPAVQPGRRSPARAAAELAAVV